MKFDRETYFDSVRQSLFGGSMDQGQVDGQNVFLDRWERQTLSDDLRWLAYALATAFHETAQTMQPIAEYGNPTCGGAEYAKEDPETGQRYYGRGFAQLTWRDNYARATEELGLIGPDDIEKHAERALDLKIAADVMFRGMYYGWFRSAETLPRYFNDTTDDPYEAREIINGDKSRVPDWSNGVSIGDLIVGYHEKFLDALEDAAIVAPGPAPQPATVAITLTIDAPPGVVVTVNGQAV
jgi:hypothetical protein